MSFMSVSKRFKLFIYRFKSSPNWSKPFMHRLSVLEFPYLQGQVLYFLAQCSQQRFFCHSLTAFFSTLIRLWFRNPWFFLLPSPVQLFLFPPEFLHSFYLCLFARFLCLFRSLSSAAVKNCWRAGIKYRSLYCLTTLCLNPSLLSLMHSLNSSLFCSWSLNSGSFYIFLLVNI